MVNESERIRWLRGCVLARLGTAQEAPGNDWRADTEGCCAVSGDRGVLLETGSQGYAPSGEREKTVRHVVLNDPQDTFARCESELTMLDMYTDTATVVARQEEHLRVGLEPLAESVANRDYLDGRRELAVLTAVVEEVARAYRHWPGWDEHWGHLNPNT